uniref:Protein FAM43A n=1 Tax=Cacopsylla melanoneura TaxID=428564 RepID=A0A8D8UI45_9HEMI
MDTGNGREENGGKDFKQKTFKSIRNNINKLLWRRKSVTITQYDSTYKVSYLGNVLCGWTKGESCIDKPIKTLWSNYKHNSKPNVQMKITITQSGLKALTKQHGLTEYWSNRITYCVQPSQYPKIFCWIYRHEGRKLKQELRCHAVLCSKEIVAKKICNELNLKLSQALQEFKKDKILKQNARLSLANCVYDNPSLPRRKLLLSTGSSNYKPPLERSKSAPKLMVIEEDQEEESTDDHIDYKKYSNYCIQQYGGTLKYSRPNNHHYNKFNSLKYNRSKSTISQLNRNNSLDSILESANTGSTNSCDKIYNSCLSINQLDSGSTGTILDTVEDETLPSCSSTPVDDVLEDPLTINEQLSINFNPNYDNAMTIQSQSELIMTNPNPNEEVKEYEIHLNPKFNLLKTAQSSNSSGSSHKLGKLLRNKSLDSILADNNANSYDSNKNIHRKSWCYGDEKTLSMIIDSAHQQTKKQSSCCNSVEKLNQPTHAFSSFEHINNLIDQSKKSADSKKLQDSVQDCKKQERYIIEECEVMGNRDTKIGQSKDATSTNLSRTNVQNEMEKSVDDLLNAGNIEPVIENRIEDIDDKKLTTSVDMNKISENDHIPIDFDEFSINTDEETNILNEYKYKKYSHHRLPSIESGFHDQIDSDSLLETTSESDSNYDSINHNNVQISADETDNYITCELLRNSALTKQLEAINENVKLNQQTFKPTIQQHIHKDDTQVTLDYKNNTNCNMEITNEINCSYDRNANLKTSLSNQTNTSSFETSKELTETVTSDDVKNMCKNSSSTQAKTNRMSRILDKINSFNENIESTHTKSTTSKNKPILSNRIMDRSNSYEENKTKQTNSNHSVNNINLKWKNTPLPFSRSSVNVSTLDYNSRDKSFDQKNDTDRVTIEPNKIDETSKNITNISNENTNHNSRIPSANQDSKANGEDENDIKISQSVKNKIKEFNSLRKNSNSNSDNTVVIRKISNHSDNAEINKINNNVLAINSRVTITKTIRKNGIANPKLDANPVAFNTLNTSIVNTLPKLKTTRNSFIPNNINADVNNLTHSLDYSINLSNSQTKHVNKINKHEDANINKLGLNQEVNKVVSNQDVNNLALNQIPVDTTNTGYDTNSLVKKRKQMFENAKSGGGQLKKVGSSDDDNTSIIRNRKSLFENFNVGLNSLNPSCNGQGGFFNSSNGCGSSQGFYNGAARFMAASNEDEDSDESGYVESQELETLQQVNNNYVQV